MSNSEISRVKERAKSRRKIDEIFENSNRAYVVHYSCESFYEKKSEGSTRVTSIAIRNLSSAQTKSWSIHKSAELAGKLGSIAENIDMLECTMLSGYFDFLKKHSDCTFMHWNMRDENYGFGALEHRFQVLQGNPYILADDKKVDLARVLVSLYGRNYASHISPSGRKGRLMAIMEINNIADKDALQGADEAMSFENQEYLKLHQSTLRKVDVFANIFDRIHSNTLKTQSSFIDKYGIHPVALIEVVKAHPMVTVLLFLGTVAGAVASYWRAITTVF